MNDTRVVYKKHIEFLGGEKTPVYTLIQRGISFLKYLRLSELPLHMQDVFQEYIERREIHPAIVEAEENETGKALTDAYPVSIYSAFINRSTRDKDFHKTKLYNPPDSSLEER